MSIALGVEWRETGKFKTINAYLDLEWEMLVYLYIVGDEWSRAAVIFTSGKTRLPAILPILCTTELIKSKRTRQIHEE
jgi:hypothetical protein